MIEASVVKYYDADKGPEFALERKRKEADLTAEMILNGTWETLEFKKININAMGKETLTGDLHPLLKVKQQFQSVLLGMGFEEMPTNNYVESSFWNFDTLFVPQQHPARDVQDTFFLADPATAEVKDKEYFEKVKETHQKGIEKSIG